MQDFQLVAHQHPCYEAAETLDPRFHQVRYLDAKYLVSVTLTANIGEE